MLIINGKMIKQFGTQAFFSGLEWSSLPFWERNSSSPQAGSPFFVVLEGLGFVLEVSMVVFWLSHCGRTSPQVLLRMPDMHA